ncbi:MAG TPA: tyrosine-type recombinase/integrase [Xanthobacteraceae bacterium]|nr:tyrosine-type recombinase/integrase [Xanthobacteraceae bacterium]
MKPFRYVQSFVDRKTGAVFHYFRRRGYPRVRLPGLPGSREFIEAYQRAVDNPQMPIGAARTKQGTVNAALVGYYDSTMFFGSLASSTQAIRRQILERFRAEHGDKPIALLPKKFIVLTLGKMKPSVAINWLAAIRHLMQYAISANLCEADPTQGIKLKTPKSDGIYTWNEQDIADYEAVHAVGTKARLVLALGLYTAQRRNDVLRMGRQHIRDGILHVKQQKTGAELRIPVHPDLRAVIDATPGEHLTFLVTRTGKPYAGDNFSEQFRAWCKAARLPDKCSFHGLRKAACRRLAEAGCSVNEIAAISGHATLREVQRYTNAVDQERMARNAMARQVNDSATSSVKSGQI